MNIKMIRLKTSEVCIFKGFVFVFKQFLDYNFTCWRYFKNTTTKTRLPTLSDTSTLT